MMAQAYNLRTQEEGAEDREFKGKFEANWATTWDADSNKQQNNNSSKKEGGRETHTHRKRERDFKGLPDRLSC